MAARIETLRNDLIITTLEKESFQFRLEQNERFLRLQRAEGQRDIERLMSRIAFLEKHSGENRKEVGNSQRNHAGSPGRLTQHCEITAHGETASNAHLEDVYCVA